MDRTPGWIAALALTGWAGYSAQTLIDANRFVLYDLFLRATSGSSLTSEQGGFI